MKKGEIRDTQLASLIAEELDYVFSSANDSRLAELTITGVETKSRGGHFVVYVAPQEGSKLFTSEAEISSVLKKASGFLRSELSKLLNLKRTPDLTFIVSPLCSYCPGEEEDLWS